MPAVACFRRLPDRKLMRNTNARARAPPLRRPKHGSRVRFSHRIDGSDMKLCGRAQTLRCCCAAYPIRTWVETPRRRAVDSTELRETHGGQATLPDQTIHEENNGHRRAVLTARTLPRISGQRAGSNPFLFMQIFKIKKKSGKWRTIYAPSPDEKEACLEILPEIAATARSLDTEGTQHGFTEGRSPVTNALAHIGWQFTLTMDLQDFFDSVTPKHVQHVTSECCFVDGAARQGLPTSPALANLAAAPMDRDIHALNITGRFGKMFKYTRYADDLAFSFDLRSVGEMLMREVPKIIERHGFKLNTEKTHWQNAKAGRRMITGAAVDNEVHAPRELRRRIRAAAHQLRTGRLTPRTIRKLGTRQAELLRRKGWEVPLRRLLRQQHDGLTECAKMKLPYGFTSNQAQVQVQPRTQTQVRRINNKPPHSRVLDL